jgi:hypothetical protein
MRSLRRYFRRIVLLVAVVTIGAGMLLPTQHASAVAREPSIDTLLAHDGGLHLDGQGVLLDFSTATVAIARPIRPLHEILHGPSLDAEQGTSIVLGAPSGVVGNITGATSDIGGVFVDIVGNVVDGAGNVVEGAKVVGNNIVNGAGVVIGTVKDIKNVIDPNCDWFNFAPSNIANCLKNRIGAASCLLPPLAIATAFVFEEWGCVSFLKRVLKQFAAWALNEILKNLIFQLNEGLRNDVVYMANYTLIEMLGKNRAGGFNFAPVIDCNWVSDKNADGSPNDAAQACSTAGKGQGSSRDYWFTGQYRLMRIIGLFILVPMMMLVIIQSVIRGSLFFLLRAVLIMLPTAVIGSVVLFTVVQIMSNVVDDMALYIANHTLNGPAQFGRQFIDAMAQLDADSYGTFTVFWFLLLLLSMIIIFLELMLRQIGIYLTLLFIPLGFATMVYPPTMRWLKRGITLTLALLVMKVFITAALSMGYAALASTVQSTKDGDVDIIVNQTILAFIVLLSAGYGGAKILAFTPAAEAASSRIASPGEVLGMGDFTGQQLQKWGGKVMDSVGKASQGSGSGGGVGVSSGMAGAPPPRQEPETGAEEQTAAPGQNGPGNAPPAPDPAAPTTTVNEGQGKGFGDTVRDGVKDTVSTATSAAEGAGGGGGAGDKSSRGNSTTSPSDKSGNGGDRNNSRSDQDNGDARRSEKATNQGGGQYSSNNGAGKADNHGGGQYSSNHAAATRDDAGSAPPPPDGGGS